MTETKDLIIITASCGKNLELSEKFPTRCKVINADRDPSKISKEIINQYENLIQV